MAVGGLDLKQGDYKLTQVRTGRRWRRIDRMWQGNQAVLMHEVRSCTVEAVKVDGFGKVGSRIF